MLLISRFRGAIRRRPTQLRTALVAALCVAVTASAANSLIDLGSPSPYAGDVGVLSTAWMRQPTEVDEFRVEPPGIFVPDEDELLDPPKHSQQPPSEEPAGGPVALAPVPQPGGGGGGGGNPGAPPPTSRPVIPAGSAAIGEILISRSRLMSLPTSGGAWQALVNEANGFSRVNLSDQNDSNDVRLLALALVTVRTGGDLGPVYAGLAAVPGTEGGDTLALGRNLLSVVLAADLSGYRDPAFVSWLRGVVRANLDGRTLISTHENRPNNWGTHAGASRIAADLYLGDGADLGRAAAVFRGWLGERGAYAGFSYGDLDWQANPNAPVGINPAGATIDGRNVDGVLPDDQRRAGGFTWPPQQENYVYEALQGALMQAELLSRAGYPAYDWSNQALRRAYSWLNNVAGFAATGDDRWQMPLVNARYGTGFAGSGGVGKNFAFTDWLYR